MSEPFQAIKIDPTIWHVTWHGEDVYFVHKSPVWEGKWRAFSKKPLLKDDTDPHLNTLLARLKAQCERVVLV